MVRDSVRISPFAYHIVYRHGVFSNHPAPFSCLGYFYQVVMTGYFLFCLDIYAAYVYNICVVDECPIVVIIMISRLPVPHSRTLYGHVFPCVIIICTGCYCHVGTTATIDNCFTQHNSSSIWSSDYDSRDFVIPDQCSTT